MNKISLGEYKVPYEVYRRDVKYPRVEITPQRLVRLILPKDGLSPEEALERKGDWLSGKYEKIDSLVDDLGLKVENYKNKILFLGDPYELVKKRGEVRVRVKKGKMIISATREEDYKKVLKNWMKAILKEKVTVYAQEFARRLKVNYRSIAIRGQFSKWGSCSGNGNLTINYKAISLPEDLLEYLVAHESAHLIEKRHKGVFWDNLKKISPGDVKKKEEKLLGYWFFIHHFSFMR